VPVTELRAGIVIGSGSASFALLRAAAAFPVAVAAPFTRSRTQPIGEADLLDLLVAVVDDPRAAWETLEVAGDEVLTYGELVARVRDLSGRRPAIDLPFPYLPPEIAATGAATITRLDPALVLPLVRSAEADAVVADDHVRRLYPDLPRTPLDEAIVTALGAPDG
jgi:uncharacterized protein YbjT (DUF2867 family)